MGTASEEPTSPQVQVFNTSFDEVWRAVQKTLAGYPIQINNIDQGLVETDVINNNDIWRAPFRREAKYMSPRYMLRVNVTRGKMKNRDSTRVSIFKNMIIEKDFFSGIESRPSDGYEEKSLLYRIDRELKIERSMKRAFEQN